MIVERCAGMDEEYVVYIFGAQENEGGRLLVFAPKQDDFKEGLKDHGGVGRVMTKEEAEWAKSAEPVETLHAYPKELVEHYLKINGFSFE